MGREPGREPQAEHTPAEAAGPALGTLLAGRFRLRALLGAGAFGAVYSALDERDHSVVALKFLKRVTGASIFRFKQEFRALAEARHPNLVRLHELFAEGDDWFFTMELIDGVPFDFWVIGAHAGADTAQTTPDTVSAEPPPLVRAPPPDVAKLRAALPQLVSAVRHLHALGVVHRDLKPANVLVTPEGRLVVLDFGLATDADPDAQQSTLGVVAGTPRYMAPEQALGRVATPAVDFYALGVMLFEVLFGRPPFSGTAHDALTAKLSRAAAELPQQSGFAPDLDALCLALLAPEPRERPDGAAIEAALLHTSAGASAAPATATTSAGAAPAPAPTAGPVTGPIAAPALFVGRERELRALDAAFADVQRGRAVVMRVRGQSGVGKSALVREHTRRLGKDVLVLDGRCYEREQVPYKALDGVVDALTRYLRRLTVAEASVLVPREAKALCRLFPVFARLHLLAEQPERQRSSSPHEERRRGFLALREMLGRIADRRPLVVVIDDLQWGDVDSIEPLRALLSPPDPPPMLVLLVFRSEDEGRSPALAGLATLDQLSGAAEVRDLDIAALSDADARALAERLLPPEHQHRAAFVARESGGLPYYLPELARAQSRTSSGEAPLPLDAVVRARIDTLSPPAKKLLSVVAVAGRPVPRRVATRAAGLESGSASAIDELVHENFLRSAPSEDSALETFHDRVRESVVAALPSDALRGIHAALADALTTVGDADPEALAEHYQNAGALELARPAAILAAERATDAFAFERAIALFSRARDGAPSEERRLLTSRLADVLAYAGRSREAAHAYLEAMEGAPAREQRDLRRRAAHLLLRCGDVAEGTVLVRGLLSEFGMSWPERRGAVLASTIANKTRLALRGYKFKEKSLGPDDEDERALLELYWTIGTCFAPIDVMRSTDFQTRYLLRALALGEPYRVARGYALEAILLTLEGGKARETAAVLAARASEIAARIHSAHALGWAHIALSINDWVVGRWRRAVRRVDEALAIMRAREPEGAWEIALTEIWFRNRSLFFLGELDEFIVSSERCTRSARERGDQLTLTTGLSVCTAHVKLLEGRPDEAREVSASGVRDWTKDGWHFQHQENLRACMQADLYAEDAPRALKRLGDHWTRLDRSFLLRDQSERIQSFSIFTNACLQAGDVAGAHKWAARLAKDQHNPWGRALADAARAGVLARKKHDDAPAVYETAAAQLDALEMVLYAAAARRRRGEVLGGSEGEAIVRDVDALLSSRGVKEPARWARMLIA